jgi:hypothetical protein
LLIPDAAAKVVVSFQSLVVRLPKLGFLMTKNFSPTSISSQRYPTFFKQHFDLFAAFEIVDGRVASMPRLSCQLLYCQLDALPTRLAIDGGKSNLANLLECRES